MTHTFQIFSPRKLLWYYPLFNLLLAALSFVYFKFQYNGGISAQLLIAVVSAVCWWMGLVVSLSERHRALKNVGPEFTASLLLIAPSMLFPGLAALLMLDNTASIGWLIIYSILFQLIFGVLSVLLFNFYRPKTDVTFIIVIVMLVQFANNFFRSATRVTPLNIPVIDDFFRPIPHLVGIAGLLAVLGAIYYVGIRLLMRKVYRLHHR